jgi:transcriptional regulator
MYTPKAFLCDDVARLHALMRASSFATLIAPASNGALEITHLPFVVDEHGRFGRLRAHVARANPVAKAVLVGARMTVVFAGPHGYVSPLWYEEPFESVPTWSYTAVHAHGAAVAMTSEELRASLDDLARAHELDPNAWSVAKLPEAFVAERLTHILGFAIVIDRLDGKTKLSQNKSPADHARVVARLRERGTEADRAMAEMMDSDPKKPR